MGDTGMFKRIVFITAVLAGAITGMAKGTPVVRADVITPENTSDVINNDDDHLPGSCNNPVICNGPSTNPFENPPSGGGGGGEPNSVFGRCLDRCSSDYISCKRECPTDIGERGCLVGCDDDFSSCRSLCFYVWDRP